MARYTIYITVNPKLLLEKAAVIKSADANKKKIYAQNIGGSGEYHINMILATKFDIIPIISAVNLTG